MVATTLCLMLGQHRRLWINENLALDHRSYWRLSQRDILNQYFNVGP